MVKYPEWIYRKELTLQLRIEQRGSQRKYSSINNFCNAMQVFCGTRQRVDHMTSQGVWFLRDSTFYQKKFTSMLSNLCLKWKCHLKKCIYHCNTLSIQCISLVEFKFYENRYIHSSYYHFYIHTEITHSLEKWLFCNFGCKRVWKAYDDIYLRKNGFNVTSC